MVIFETSAIAWFPIRLPFAVQKAGFLMNALKALMIVAFAEAISWLGLLLGMVLKYGFDNEAGVSLMGPIHGMLFVVFAALLLITHFQERWSIGRTVLSFIESIPPVTGFLLGKQLLDEVRLKEASQSNAS